MTKDESAELRSKMAAIAITFAAKLDTFYHYGNFGVDLAIDRNMEIWTLNLLVETPITTLQ